jgi:hypothetical protein
LFSYAKNAWPPGKNTSVPEGEPEFRDLDICVQLRMIYEYFAVFDEDGQELLNLETIKSEDFRSVPEEEFIKEWFGASYDESDYVDTTNWILVVE